MFSITQKLVLDQQCEFFGVSTIYWDQTPSIKSTLVHLDATELLTAKVCAFSDSVRCSGGNIAEYPQSVQSWTDKIERFTPIVNWAGLTENPSCSSGRFSQGTPR